MAKKKGEQSGENLPSVTLFKIVNELEAIRYKAAQDEGVLSDADFDALKTWEAAIEVKAENIGHVLVKLECDAEYYDRIEKAAYARKKRLEDAHARLKKYLRDAMAFSGTKSVKKADGLFSITLCDGKTKAIIDDQTKLPYSLVDIVEVVKPRNDAIKKALEAGEDIPGAHLEQGESYLRIV